MKYQKTILLAFFLKAFVSVSQLNQDLILDLTFDNSFADMSNSNAAITNNGVSFISDASNNSNSAAFFSNGDFLSSSSALLKNDLPFTMSFWIKRESNNIGGVVFSSDNIFDNYYGYWVAIGPNGEIGTHIAGGLGGATSSNRRGLITNTFLQVGVWQHVVIIFRNYNDIDVYFDCIKQPGFYTGSGSTTMSFSNSESRIGGQIGNSSNSNGVFLNGSLDNFKLWKREITLEEIDLLCKNRASVPEFDNFFQSVSIYPNPTSGKFSVNFEEINQQISVEIYDVNSRLIYSNTLSDLHNELDLSEIRSGVYSVVLIVGDFSHARKLVIVD